MWTAEHVLELSRRRLADLIALERKACGSACQAVKTVAKRIKSSPGWVRKIVGRYGEASVHAHLHLNIKKEHRLRTGFKSGAARVVSIIRRKVTRSPHVALTSEIQLEN